MWYRFENDLINIEKLYGIYASLTANSIVLLTSPSEWETKDYPSREIRDAEFEKISKMLGLDEPEHISRCC